MRKLFYTFICLLFFIGTSFGASIILNPKFLVLVDGEPLSGGLVYTYECGTTTAKATYTTYTGGTANANPVVLSAQGEASIYASGCLKVILKTSAGAAIADGTIDNIQSFDSTILQDADRDTKIQCEESADEDVLRFDINGTQKMYIDSTGVHTTGVSFSTGYGVVHRPKFRWKDADEIYIGAGAYHHDGTSEQFVYWSSEITFHLESTGSNALSDDYGADGWHYIYLDDSAIITQASTLLDADCFLNDMTAPTWSATKHGWYNSSDRCIFAVHETSGAILEFFHDGGNFISHAVAIDERTLGDLDTVFTDVDCATSIPGFSTKASIVAQLENVAGSALTRGAFWRMNGATDATGVKLIGVEWPTQNHTVQISGIIVFTDSNQIFEVVMGSSDDSKLGILCSGWYFPTRM